MSPYGLVQERVSRDLNFPWRVLVCCAMLNRTTKEQARPALSAFFVWYETPYALQFDNTPHVLAKILRPLGLGSRRQGLLYAMTEDYLEGMSPYECYGVGQYARDALDLFCAGLVPSSVSDHWLRPYADWRLAGGERIEWDEEGYLEFAIAAGKDAAAWLQCNSDKNICC